MMSVTNDRAWNDPPPLPFSDCQSTCSRRTTLNKRVAFPLHKSEGIPSSVGKKDSDEKATAESFPPVESCPPVVIDPAMHREKEITKDVFENNLTDEEMLVAIQLTFGTLVDGFTTQIPQEDIAAIKRKLIIFTHYWGMKLSPVVKQKMYQLTTELAAGRMETAEKLRQELVVNNTREVAPWMVAVKHLIQNAQKSAPESTDSDKVSEGTQNSEACTFQPDSEADFKSS